MYFYLSQKGDIYPLNNYPSTNQFPNQQPQYSQNSTQPFSSQYPGQPLYPQENQSPMQQPPRYEPPVQPPKKKNKNLPWIIALIVVFFVGIGVGHAGNSTDTTTTANTTSKSIAGNSANTQPTQAPATPTPTPTQVPKTWQMTHTYNGNGQKKTETITVPGDWKLQWTCDPTSFSIGEYNLAVTVTATDNTPVDLAVNTICKDGNTSGETEEHQGGQVFLDVNSEAAWTITIQELK
jgi:hypothetical protein